MIKILVRYLGILRLYSGKQYEELQFKAGPVRLSDVLARLQTTLNPKLSGALAKQTIMLSTAPDQPGIVLTVERDLARELADGSCITLVTPLTGG